MRLHRRHYAGDFRTHQRMALLYPNPSICLLFHSPGKENWSLGKKQNFYSNSLPASAISFFSGEFPLLIYYLYNIKNLWY